MQCAGGNDQIERSNGSGAVRVTDEGAGRPGVQFNPHLEYREADGNILEPTVKICALYACCRFDPGFFFLVFFLLVAIHSTGTNYYLPLRIW